MYNSYLFFQNLSYRNLCNRSATDIGAFGYIDVILPKNCSPEVWQIPPETSL
jgi:hypothetical protein